MTDKLFQKAISWAETKGFSNIKANYGDYERPTTYSKPKEDRVYVPDITAQKSGNKCYIEIATKDDNPRRSVSKWKLMAALAEMTGGKLFLLTPRGHKAFVERMIKKYRVNAQLVYLSGA